jgi:hypothetical protein
MSFQRPPVSKLHNSGPLSSSLLLIGYVRNPPGVYCRDGYFLPMPLSCPKSIVINKLYINLKCMQNSFRFFRMN